MNGGDGNDTYIVDNTLDRVGESFDDVLGGTADTVKSSVSYTLGSGTTPGSNGFGIENLTLTGSGSINGTGNAKNNLIIGNSGNNILLGGAGVDTLRGGSGNDTLTSDGDGGRYFGDAGNDLMFSGLGTETMDGGTGTDTINHSAFSGAYVFNMSTGLTNFGGELYVNFENVVMGAGNDTVTGNSSANLINGGAGNDQLFGGDGNDTLVGGTGTDTLRGGNGNDTLTSDGDGGQYFGDAGNDLMFSGLGTETMDGGTGTDTINHSAWSGDYAFNMSTGLTDFGGELYVNFENAVMGAGNDTVTGNSSANLINGGAGNDQLFGEDGNDTLIGGAGVDTLRGGNGDDRLTSDGDGGRYFGDAGNDLMFSGLGTETMDGGTGTDTINHSAFSGAYVFNMSTGLTNFGGELYVGFENVVMGAGNDSVTGTSGANVINGGAGVDTMNGGDGNDTYIVDNTLDQVGESFDDALGGTADTIQSSVSYTLGSGTTSGSNGFGIENLTLTGNASINGTGNAKNNLIIGNAGNNILLGGAGVDTLRGGSGNDTLTSDGDGGRYFGDAGNDLMFSGLGTETMDGGTGTDTINHSAFSGTYVFNMSTGLTNFGGELYVNFENVIMGAGNDTVTGNSSANLINGGAGNDVLNGGAGIDTLTGGAGVDTFVLANRGTSNADKITDFSSVDDTIALANALDVGLPGAISPGVLGLVFSGGNVAGSVLSGGWFFKGAGSTGNGNQLSGIFADTTTGNIFYNPTSGTVGDSALIASIGIPAMAALTNADFIYAV